MEEIKDILEKILEELVEMNSKIDSIKGIGSFNTISEICDKLDDIDFSIRMLD